MLIWTPHTQLTKLSRKCLTLFFSSYIGAVNLSGVPVEEQRLVFMGAGSAGVGVAKQLVEYYTKRGLSEQAAKDKFWLVDTKGLVTKDRGDKLAEHKKYFARSETTAISSAPSRRSLSMSSRLPWLV